MSRKILILTYDISVSNSFCTRMFDPTWKLFYCLNKNKENYNWIWSFCWNMKVDIVRSVCHCFLSSEVDLMPSTQTKMLRNVTIRYAWSGKRRIASDCRKIQFWKIQDNFVLICFFDNFVQDNVMISEVYWERVSTSDCT